MQDGLYKVCNFELVSQDSLWVSIAEHANNTSGLVTDTCMRCSDTVPWLSKQIDALRNSLAFELCNGMSVEWWQYAKYR